MIKLTQKIKFKTTQLCLTATCISLLTISLIVPTKVNAFTISELADWIWKIITNTAENELNLEGWEQILENVLDKSCRIDEIYEGVEPVILFFAPPESDWCNKSSGDVGFEPIGDIIRDSQGPMNIPAPNETRGRIENAANKIDPATNADIFEINNVVWGIYAANQVDRDLTRVGVESVLGKSGQEKMQGSIDETKNIVQQIGKDADAAQKLDVTQDVMKMHTKAFAQQTAILGSLRADNLRARIDTQYTNLNLTNISRSLDEVTRSERVNLAGNTMLLLKTAGQASLR